MNASIEDAQLNWSKGECELAIKLVQTVVDAKSVTMAYIKAIGICGEYLAETRAENTKTVVDSYLRRSVTLSKRFSETNHFPETHELYKTDDERKRFNVANQQRNSRAIAMCKPILIHNVLL